MLKYFCIQYIACCIIILFVANSFAQEFCRSDTCRYGECEQLATGYNCHCEKGIKGRNCDQILLTNENPCLSNPCWNAGTCIKPASNSDWYCQCPAGYIGYNCKVSTNSSCFPNNPCKNNGICLVGAGNGQICLCVNEYTGKYCETKIPLCERKLSCFNGASCINNKCVCAQCFTGEFCQTYKSPLSLNTARIKNKGGYTATATLTYRYLNKDFTLKKTLLSGQSYTFGYQCASSNIILTVGALAYSKDILKTTINQEYTCFDVYGALPYPKYTPVSC